jgi:hypothetical protein
MVESDDCGPSALTLAASSGHADVVRLLLAKWPEASTDQAFTLAMVWGHTATARLLEERSVFTWSKEAWRALSNLPEDRVIALVSRYLIDWAAAKSIGIRERWQDVCWGLDALLRVPHPTRGLVRCVVAWFAASERPSLSHDLLKLLQIWEVSAHPLFRVGV